MEKIGKFRNNSGMTSTHRTENIFPKYLLYNVHEIARKYPREKYRYSSFSDSVVLKWKYKVGFIFNAYMTLRSIVLSVDRMKSKQILIVTFKFYYS